MNLIVTIVVILLIVALLGGGRAGLYAPNYGYGGIGFVLVVLLILFLMGRL